VRATLDDGTTGFGEGVPRPYVTGETIASTFRVLSKFDAGAALGVVKTLDDLVQRVGALELPETLSDPRGMASNAARCALELAILDAATRALGSSVSEVVRHAGRGKSWLRPAPGTVRYSGAVTADSPDRERASAWKMRLYGFRQVKVKVGVTGQDDAGRLASLRKILGKSMDIRLDANEAWPAGELLEKVHPLLRFRPTALEQPVPHREVGRLSELMRTLTVRIILDESLCGFPDGVRALNFGYADIFNIRLSKCGGILPSLRLVDLAARGRLGVQLGCHPGETGILSAAGRHVATNLGGILYLEGSYDRHVLRENLIHGDITFGYGGRARPIHGPGLGVTVDPARLERLTVDHMEVSFD
jgi:muconate cycloisomerase